MKRTVIKYNEKLGILRRLSQVPKMSQEEVAMDTRHRKANIGEVLKEFKSLDWESAKAFCGNDQRILGLRDAYFENKMADERDQEEALKALQENMRYELGAPTFITYKKDGVWVSEF